jgi:chromate transporter
MKADAQTAMVVHENKTMPLRPGLIDLGGIMARFGSLTFGGGGPTTVALERVLVFERGWLRQSALRLAFALSRLTPGTNIFAFCTGLGWQVRGGAGALIALMGASIPCSVVTIGATVLLDAWQKHPTAAAVIRVAAALSIGLIVGSCWPLVRPHIRRKSWPRTTVLLAGAVVLQLADVPPIRVLLLAGVAGSLWREPA